jgi:hypothetical protein
MGLPGASQSSSSLPTPTSLFFNDLDGPSWNAVSPSAEARRYFRCEWTRFDSAESREIWQVDTVERLRSSRRSKAVNEGIETGRRDTIARPRRIGAEGGSASRRGEERRSSLESDLGNCRTMRICVWQI